MRRALLLTRPVGLGLGLGLGAGTIARRPVAVGLSLSLASSSSRGLAAGKGGGGGKGGKGGGGGGGGKGGKRGTASEDDDGENEPPQRGSSKPAAGAAANVDADSVQATAKAKFGEALERLEQKLAQLRVGGAEADMLDDLMVPVSTTNKRVPLKQLASVACPNAKQLVVTVHDESNVGDVSKAIAGMPHMGLTPQVSGTTIQVGIPKTTKEHREARTKQAMEMVEAAKLAIKKTRGELHAKLKKASLPEDAEKRAEKALQQAVDAANDKASAFLEKKKKELMQG